MALPMFASCEFAIGYEESAGADLLTAMSRSFPFTFRRICRPSLVGDSLFQVQLMLTWSSTDAIAERAADIILGKV